jgi:hypothetical protein
LLSAGNTKTNSGRIDSGESWQVPLRWMIIHL